MQEYKDLFNNVHITAKELIIGNNVKFGKDIKIHIRGKFQIGDNSIIGDRFTANAEELIIGEYFYNGPTDSRGMTIGGGGSNFPFAKLHIGDRMVCHTGHINLASPVTIGNDVGLSHDVDLITHGFWYSILDGYPRVFKEINIGNNVIVGWKTVIMSGVDIADNTVIGSHSTVTKSLLESKAIYAGSPAKLIKHINEPTREEKLHMMRGLISDFKDLMSYYEVPDFTINADYPYLYVNQLQINVDDFSYNGEHDVVTDAFRDFARRYGIRIYVPHGFKFNLTRK
jgi:acetyltransferase-like isoleucine patch superfamily enzyme